VATTNDRKEGRETGGPGHGAMRTTEAPNQSAPPDAACESGLLERLRRGDSAAAAEFYDRYAARVRRFIMQSLGPGAPPQDAEDLSQETFIAIAEALPFFRGDSSLFTFACAIAHRKTMSFIRTNARRARLAAAVPIENRSVATPPPGDERLRRAMAVLKPEYREMLHLKYVEEVTTAEIAAIVRKTEHAVESTLARARRALRKLMEMER
jgi:RNA polymerase sigma-70 factor (ECF subfamily)